MQRTVDLSAYAGDGHFLEGTGSLILDRPRWRAFASRSVRTDAEVITEFDRELRYSTFQFDAFDHLGRPIYHTNVLLCLGTEFAILCSEVIPEAQRAELIERLGRTVIEVSYDQLRQFACNSIELRGRDDTPIIAMSSASLASLTGQQVRQLERFGNPVTAPIPTIESVGGGSVRCMIADVHLPRREAEAA